MARLSMRSKLKRLEKRQKKRCGNCLALEYEVDSTGVPTNEEVAAWLLTPNPSPENAPAAFLEPYRGILNEKVILVPNFGTDSDWEIVTARQQVELQAVCRSRTNEPTTTTPAKVIVGSRFEDRPAPLVNGKDKRFMELADGRVFDKETRQYLDSDYKPIVKDSGLSFIWHR